MSGGSEGGGEGGRGWEGGGDEEVMREKGGQGGGEGGARDVQVATNTCTHTPHVSCW